MTDSESRVVTRESLADALDVAFAKTGYVIKDETSGLDGAEPALVAAIFAALPPAPAKSPTWWRDDCVCPVLDTAGDGCLLSTDTDSPTHLCHHCLAHAAALPAGVGGDREALDSDDFRDAHERAFRAHVLGAADLHVEHVCDDLCSAAVIDRILGKHPVNEYPWQPAATPDAEGLRTALATFGVHRNTGEFTCGVWLTGSPAEPLDDRCDCGLSAALDRPEQG